MAMQLRSTKITLLLIYTQPHRIATLIYPIFISYIKCPKRQNKTKIDFSPHRLTKSAKITQQIELLAVAQPCSCAKS